jgi:hypothetical protein
MHPCRVPFEQRQHGQGREQYPASAQLQSKVERSLIGRRESNYSSVSAAAVFLVFGFFSGLDCLGLLFERRFSYQID